MILKKGFKTKCIAILLIFSMLICFTACGTNNTTNNASTKTITDCIGRNVEIPKNPQRVACLYASTAHIIAMLDETDKIVGAPNGIKRDVLMQMKISNIKDLSVPFSSDTINIEELLSENADLILIRESTALNHSETDKLNKIGIPYVVVDYSNIEELRKAILLVGDIFNDEDKANDYIDFFDDTINLVEDKLKDLPTDDQKNVYHSVNEATRTDVNDDICSEIFQKAHIKDTSVINNIKSGGEKTFTNIEEIYKWNPEYIICNEYGVTNYILTDSKWSGLSAVENKNVYTLPTGATRWCHPGSMEAHMGVLSLAYIFYPEYFTDFNYKSYIKDYYKKYFNIDLDENQIEMIITGNGMRNPKES